MQKRSNKNLELTKNNKIKPNKQKLVEVYNMTLITLDSMKNLSVDEIVRLYQFGYRIEGLVNPIVDPVVNFGKVIVSLPYDNIATSIILQTGNGAKLPDPSVSGAFNLVWWNYTDYPDPSDDPYVEIVRCTVRSTDTLTITRSQEGISASNKNVVGKTYKMILALTAKMISDIQTDSQSKVNTHTALNTNVHGIGTNYVAMASGSQYTAVNKAGDTMTGVLNLPANGLIVGTNQLIVSGGNVGIGTTSPGTRLDIQSSTNTALRIYDGSVTTSTIELKRTSDNWHLGTIRTTYAGAYGNNLLFDLHPNDGILSTAPLTRLFIQHDGNVGIGTTGPGQKLSVAGIVESTSGGFKFPDGSTQTTASGGIGNTANLLASITPTFSGWNTNPGTNADITSELTTTLTTSGTSMTGTATILYDLGVSKRIIFYMLMGFSQNATDGGSVLITMSDDNSTYSIQGQTRPTDNNGDNTNPYYYGFRVVVAKTRYIKITVTTGPSTLTWKRVNFRAYNI